MPQTPRTAVFLDLDGTLWEAAVVPDSALEAIRVAQANGHKILTNTGRARSEVTDLTYLGLDGFCFAAGAEVILDGETVVREPIGAEAAKAIARVFDELGFNYNLEGDDDAWIKVNNEEDYRVIRAYAAGTPDPIFSAQPAHEMPEEAWPRILKLFYHGTDIDYEQVKALMPEDVTLTYLAPGLAEATSARASKATAMEAVRAKLGPAWRTMAVGDSDNDLPTLHAADISVAMGNGNENAKAAATWVTTTIGDRGLWNAFKHFGLI